VQGSLAIACLLAALTGCGTRSLLLMEPLPPTYAWQRAQPGTDPESGSGSGSGSASASGSGSGPDAAPGPVATASALGAIWSRLPAPHRAPRATEPAPTPSTLASARSLRGVRDPRSSLAFALAAAAGLSGARAPDVADGPALVAWARARDRLAAIVPGAAEPPAIEPGDLVVFDRAVDGAPASLVAVALARDPRGVIELLYLAGGVIRVGQLDPTRPRTARDRDHRVVNTYLRHGPDQPPRGTRFLAGELVAGRVRLR
jgi:hypothetical protein